MLGTAVLYVSPNDIGKDDNNRGLRLWTRQKVLKLVGVASRRWGQLALGIVCMVAIANVQYGWTLFIDPINQKHAWGTTALQWTFSIVIATETFLAMPLGGYLIDRSSPKWACIGGPLIAIGWYLNSIADALYLFYVAAVIIGSGTGLVFAAAYGNASKWFPDKRGFVLGTHGSRLCGGRGPDGGAA